MQNNELLSQLNNKIKSTVLYDEMSLAIYATDASIYQIVPDAVIIVKEEADLSIVLKFAHEHGFKILARGGATSLAGQTVAKAIILDFSQYMNKIIEFDEANQLVVVQSGVIHGELNQYLEKSRLHFAPDPATSNRATIGGMIANNSSGTKSILYGKTSDYVKSLKVMLSDGSIVKLENKDELSYDIIAQQSSLEGEIYKELRSVVFENTNLIKSKFPKIMRRVSGYALDAFVDHKEWNLSRLVCGSEGTLAIILEAELKLVPLPNEKGICLIHFSDRMKAIQMVQEIVGFGPSAVEMLDQNVLIQSKVNMATVQQYKNVVEGDPEALLVCEFYADDEQSLNEKLNLLKNHLIDHQYVSAIPIYISSEKMNDVWNLRKKGLGLIMGIPGDKKPLPFIEDSSIPLPYLAEYIQKISDYCESLDTEIVLYAHASVGVLHIRPFLDIKQQEDIDKMVKISHFALKLVKEYGGSWSGEHGDGLVRSPNLPLFFGTQIMNCFKQIKTAFDPDYMLNPHKKTDALPMNQQLRYGPTYKSVEYDFVFNYRKENSFESVVELCSGISACRNKMTEAMCPSYRASLDEKDSPRGRANALRMVMSGQVEGEDLLSDELMDVLSLCLSCKACKSECPSNVDIAKLKAEVLQLRHDNNKTTSLEKMIFRSEQMSKLFSGTLSPIVNLVQKQPIVKNLVQRIVGIDERRSLPTYAKKTLMSWYKQQNKNISVDAQKVVLFADTHINYHETHIGKAAFALLQSCGYDVEIVNAGCCQRPKISNGFLKEAKEQGIKTALNLQSYLEANIPILVCEPGCGSALLDDLPDLIDDADLASKMQQNIHFIDDFLLKQKDIGLLKGSFVFDADHVVVHAHCHQAALKGAHTTRSLCSKEDTRIDDENTGCCGMAGAFGYDVDHYEFSQKVAERNIIPKTKLMEENSILIANGTSCRHQFEDLTDTKPKHWVETVKYVV